MTAIGRLCPGCAAPSPAALFRLESVPVLCNALLESAAAARAVPRADIDLVACRRCALLWNPLFDPAALHYGPAYGNPLDCSPTFRAHQDRLVALLRARRALEGKTILEIGCGTGGFLRALCRACGAHGIGIDPGGANHDEHLERGSLRLIRAAYPAPDLDLETELICCRHVLEHVADPGTFLERLRHDLTPSGTLLLEVPNAAHMLETGSLGDLIYEHCLYFDAHALRALAERRGYTVERIDEHFGRQFLVLLAAPGPPPPRASPATPAPSPALDSSFAARAGARLAEWRRGVASGAAAGRRLAVWGIGSKGVTFLNLVRDAGPIAAVVDINPAKQGKFVPGTGHAVCSPARLRESPVETVLVMNPRYRGEVEAELRSLGLPCDVDAVLG